MEENRIRYVEASLETHLFFGRIMKEHALFLLASFPAGETGYRNKADYFREQFEKVLERTVWLADGKMRKEVLRSGELFTEFTETAERQTRRLTKIPINIQITQEEEKLWLDGRTCVDERMMQCVRQLNQKVLCLLDGLIALKEEVLQQVLCCCLYTSNYPLLIEHILREAKMYRQQVRLLEETMGMQKETLKEVELFWNQIMMEHGMFIRGSLDPTECELMEKANDFVGEYCCLLEAAQKQDCRTMGEVLEKTMAITEEYREFKMAGTEGITGCQIRSVILPLLADHVLREANHYLRILQEEGCGER